MYIHLFHWTTLFFSFYFFLERYVLWTFVVLFLQGASFWWLADYYNFKCGENGMLDWFTGEPWKSKSGNTKK